jgi:hypothetical protein
MGAVAGHREGFEVDLGASDRRADVEEDAPFQLRDAVGEDQEVGVAGGAEGGTVAVGVGVDDVAADGHVAGDGDAVSPTGGTQAYVSMRKPLGFNHAAGGFAESFAPVDGLADDVVRRSSRLPVVDHAALVESLGSVVGRHRYRAQFPVATTGAGG